MAPLYAWVLAHLGVISSVLALIVALDHALAASDLFKANSSAQALFNGVAAVVSWVQKMLGGSPPSA